MTMTLPLWRSRAAASVQFGTCRFGTGEFVSCGGPTDDAEPDTSDYYGKFVDKPGAQAGAGQATTGGEGRQPARSASTSTCAPTAGSSTAAEAASGQARFGSDARSSTAAGRPVPGDLQEGRVQGKPDSSGRPQWRRRSLPCRRPLWRSRWWRPRRRT